ncbi:transmembrane 220 family protein [Aquirufa sp. Wall-65K1]
MNKAFLISGSLFTLIFILFAYWQLNDPDPILWVAIYLIPTYTSFKAISGKVNSELMVILFLLSGVAGLQTWVEMTAWEGFMTDGLSMKTINQELAREAVGLWITTLSFATFYLLDKKYN